MVIHQIKKHFLNVFLDSLWFASFIISFIMSLDIKSTSLPSLFFFFFFLQYFYDCDGGGLVAKLCPTLAIPWTVACQAPLSMGFSILESVAISFSRGTSQPRNQTHVSCIAVRCLTDSALRGAPKFSMAILALFFMLTLKISLSYHPHTQSLCLY